MRGLVLIILAFWLTAQFSPSVSAADGEPDPNFGQAGYALIDTAPAGSSMNDVIAGVPGPNGTIYAISHFGSVKQNNLKALVTRVTRNGQLDTTFNGTGFATTQFPLPYLFWPMDAIASSDGGVLVAGIFQTAQSRAAVCKFTPSGALDTSFGSPNDNGCPVLPGDVLPADDIAVRGRLVAITPHYNGYVVAATGILEPSTQIRIIRLNGNGLVDNLFGTNGNGIAELSNVNYSEFQTHAVTTNTDGRIFIAGTTKTGGEQVVFLAAFAATGLPDFNNWDFKGFMSFPASTFGGSSQPMFSSIHVRGNGELVSTGRVNIGTDMYGLVVRLVIATKNGVFPSPQEFPLTLGGGNFWFYLCDVCTKNEIVDIDEMPDGTIYLTGTYGFDGNTDAYVIRLDGFIPDLSFGYQGVQMYSFDALPLASVQDKAAGLVINNGVATLVGQHGSGDPGYPVFTRLSTDLIFKNGFD